MRKIDLDALAGHLPPIMARTAVPKFLGDIVSSKTLANADSLGIGPEGRFKIGRNVCYLTDQLLVWLEKKCTEKRLL